MKYFFTLLGTLLLIVSCHKDDAPEFTKQKAERAVMIYMAGENNLTKSGNGKRYLNSDIQEMIEGSRQLTDKQRLFVFVDSLTSTGSTKAAPYIMEIHNGQTYIRKQFESDFYASNPDRFEDIVGWMTSNIDAESFGLVLWGHATGWIVDPDSIVSSRRAYGVDSNEDCGSKSEKWMNITQMAQALSSQPKMDFIFADCCNMMCAEVGYELRNATDYLIGSPAEIPGDGAPYHLIVPQFFKKGSSLYKGIIDTYYDYYLEYYNESTSSSVSDLKGYSLPLAVIDTKYIRQLAEQTRDILATFTPEYPASISVSKVPFYIAIDSALMYDMMGVIQKNANASDFAVWESSYRQAVPYYRMSMRWMSAYSLIYTGFHNFNQDGSYGCVSMFFPMYSTTYDSGKYRYNTTSRNYTWNNIMEWDRFGWK